MKSVRCSARYVVLDHGRNKDILEELKVDSGLKRN
jgi:hypothetical protein